MDSVFVNPPIEVDIESLMDHIRQRARLHRPAPIEHDSQISEQGLLHDADEQDSIGGAFLAQAELNRSLIQSLAALAQNLQGIQGRFTIFEQEFRAKTEGGAKANQELSDQITDLNSSNTSLEVISKRIDGIAAQQVFLEDEIAQRLQELQDSIQVTQIAIDELGGTVESVVARISAVEHKLHSLATVEQHLSAEADHTAEVEQQTDEQPGQSSMTMEEFSTGLDHGAAGTAAIQRHLLTYLDLFKGKEAVLVIGYGRGELVELLTECGIHTTGIDINQHSIDFCRDRGLNVVTADMFDYLNGLVDGSLDGIFAARIVERLSPDEIAKFIRLSAAKLRPGGIIVAEAMNINCPGVLINLYLDPTHVRPVPAALLQFMFEHVSFKLKCLKFSTPVAGSNVVPVLDIVGAIPSEAHEYQDYAVVAEKR